MKKRPYFKEILLLMTLVIILIIVFVFGMMKDQLQQEIIAQKAQQLNEELKNQQQEENSIKSLPNISCWGDGLTTGDDSDGPSYSKVLSTLTNLTVNNMGVNREDSATIATRQGGRYLIIDDIEIPSTVTPVKIGKLNSLYNNSNEQVKLLVGGDAGINPVTIGGIEGILSLDEDSNTYYFTRSNEGKALEITEPTPLLTAAATENKNDITIIFIGQNGGYEGIEQLVEQQQAMINHLDHDKYLILGLTTGTENERSELEEALLETYGTKFINLREYLSTDGLADANIDPTYTDLNEMKFGKVPSSLLINGTIIGNYAYHELIAQKIYEKIIELNYLTEKQQRYLGLTD